MADEKQLEQWELVTRTISRAQNRVLEQLEDSGVQAQWFAVLHLLLRYPDHRLPMSHLARDLTMTSGGFTKLADRMAQDGLIDRRNSSGDRRVVYATLTEKGLELAHRAERQYRSALREHVFGALEPAALQSLAEGAGALADAWVEPVVDDVPQTASKRDPTLPDRRRRGERREDRA
jgi:DNA-binding MarR family transcriptional regulator